MIPVEIAAVHVEHTIGGDLDLSHAELVPVVQDRGSAQSEQGEERAADLRVVLVAHSRREPDDVVIRQRPDRQGATGKNRLRALDQVFEEPLS